MVNQYFRTEPTAFSRPIATICYAMIVEKKQYRHLIVVIKKQGAVNVLRRNIKTKLRCVCYGSM
jgi:hypothetical protein